MEDYDDSHLLMDFLNEFSDHSAGIMKESVEEFSSHQSAPPLTLPLPPPLSSSTSSLTSRSHAPPPIRPSGPFKSSSMPEMMAGNFHAGCSSGGKSSFTSGPQKFSNGMVQPISAPSAVISPQSMTLPVSLPLSLPPFNANSVVPIPALLGSAWREMVGCSAVSDEEDLDDDDDDEDGPGAGAGGANKNAKKKRKRVGQKLSNPDADLIAAVTAENLKAMQLDPNSKEGKKQRRRIRNRMSAQLHRERKKAYIEYLEGVVRQREAHISDILRENRMLRHELQILNSGAGGGRGGGMSGAVVGGGGGMSTEIGSEVGSSMCGGMGDFRLSAMPVPGTCMAADHRSSSFITQAMVTSTSSVSTSPYTSSSSSSSDMPGLFFTGLGHVRSTAALTSSMDDSSSMMSSSDNTSHSGASQHSDSEDSQSTGSSPTPHRSMFGQGVSLFSVVMLLSFSFLNGSPLSALSSQATPWTSSFHTTDSYFSSSEVSSLVSSFWSSMGERGGGGGAVSAPLVAEYKYIDVQSVQSQRRLSEEGSDENSSEENKDVLSSYPVIVAYKDDHSQSSLDSTSSSSLSMAVVPLTDRTHALTGLLSPATTMSVSMPVLRPTQALWKHSGRVVHLYPHAVQQMDSQLSGGVHDGVLRSSSEIHRGRRLRRHLRSHSSKDSEEQSSTSFTVSDTRLVPVLSTPTTEFDPVVKDSVSQVIMTRGRALLDPRLAVGLIRSGEESSTASDVSSAGGGGEERSVSSVSSRLSGPLDVSTAVAPRTGTVSSPTLTSLLPRILNLNPSAPASPQTSPHVPGAATAGRDDVLMMLLPASSIRWGKTWGDSAGQDMEWMLRGFSNSSEDGRSGDSSSMHDDDKSGGRGGGGSGGGGVEEGRDVWIEIGCSVFRAHLVHNVSLV